MNKQEIIRIWPQEEWDYHKCDPHITSFNSKYIVGNKKETGLMASLSTILYQHWPGDLHFAQYAHTERLTKNANSYTEVNFEIMAFDLDAHGSTTNGETFWWLVYASYLWDATPNLMYKTKNGARAIYFIEQITDPQLFQINRTFFMKKYISNINIEPYELDPTIDWTRFMRAPWVLRDNKETYHEPIHFIHNNKRDILLNTEIPAKPNYPKLQLLNGYKPNKVQNYLTTTIQEGSRQVNLFKILLLTYRSMKNPEDLVAEVLEKARIDGLGDNEIDQTHRSAIKYAKEETK
ncbi:MAG: hypothetical protein DRQ48_03875 [Gammaproteobacteria bacterium]|nr:MAG: hypothetical protein DRQ48_03875 [Gammaproteobacteria bacterium]